VPDLFPGLHTTPKKWLDAVKNPEPLVDAAQKLVERRTSKTKTTAAVVKDMEGLRKLLKEGQIFKASKAPTLKIETLTSQGNVEYKTLDKVALVSVEHFLTYLEENAYWTTPTMNWRRSSKVIWTIMAPFLGMLGSIFITKLLEKRVLK
jgi:hypothetical protein